MQRNGILKKSPQRQKNASSGKIKIYRRRLRRGRRSSIALTHTIRQITRFVHQTPNNIPTVQCYFRAL